MVDWPAGCGRRCRWTACLLEEPGRAVSLHFCKRPGRSTVWERSKGTLRTKYGCKATMECRGLLETTTAHEPPALSSTEASEFAEADDFRHVPTSPTTSSSRIEHSHEHIPSGRVYRSKTRQYTLLISLNRHRGPQVTSILCLHPLRHLTAFTLIQTIRLSLYRRG